MTRYTDMNLAASGARDFVIRKRAPNVPQLLVIFLSSLLISVSVTVSVIDKVSLVTILFILLGAIGWYVIVLLQRSRDLVLTTEFQNALFASALGSNHKFCMIIKRDGNIIYLDRPFQEMFPEFLKQPRRSVDILLESSKVSREESGKIFTAIERGVYDNVVFDIKNAAGQTQRIVMSIEPIMRPTGFILLRGREYVEARAGDDTLGGRTSPQLNRSSIALLASAMDSVGTGVYLADATGRILYANPTLNEALSFDKGEISGNGLSLQDIIYQGGGRAESIELDNFEGEVTLQKKVGGNIKAYLQQKTLRDENGKIIGCTALVQADAGKK